MAGKQGNTPRTQHTHNGGTMRPPSGFESQLYPLRHRLIYSAGLSLVTTTMNSCFFTILRHTNDVIANTPKTIVVNPHNTNYVTDNGPAVQKMSIIDRLTMSLKFNMTAHCLPTAHVSGTSTNEIFRGDGITHIKLTWRPVFFTFPEKLDAADDDTGTTVAAILGLTKDATFEDVVPLTTNKLPVAGASDLSQPGSTVNIVEDFGDYNMTTNLTMEDHPWDEDLFQEAMKRYTNKGALKACVGRTRTVHLSSNRPYKTFYIDKFVPRAVRRIMPYSFFGIQIDLPTSSAIGQDYHAVVLNTSTAHVGVKMIANFHEWNSDHFQDMSGTAPVPV